MNLQHIIKAELIQASKTLHDFMQDASSGHAVEEAAKQIVSAITSNGKIISCGNGGSHCDAMHFAEELTGRYREDRKAFPAICISDPSHISCVGNDYGYQFVFSRYVEALGNKGDVLLAISTSGNSPSIVQAAKTARKQEMVVIVLTGQDGGQLAPLADVVLYVPHSGFPDRIQEVHIKIIHILILLIEKLAA